MHGEESDRPTRESNSPREHRYRIGDLVDVTISIDESTDGHSHLQLSGRGRMYVVSCHHDCDGEPLYSLSDVPVTIPGMDRAAELGKYRLFSRFQRLNVGESTLIRTGAHFRIFNTVRSWLHDAG